MRGVLFATARIIAILAVIAAVILGIAAASALGPMGYLILLVTVAAAITFLWGFKDRPPYRGVITFMIVALPMSAALAPLGGLGSGEAGLIAAVSLSAAALATHLPRTQS